MKALAIAFVLALSACASPADEPKPIQLDEDLFMIPLEKKDKDGCQGWRLHSETRMVIQAIHYQRKDGTFTNNKLEAACYERQQ
ncbi:MAG: hypothetical protein KAI28_01420 [Sphingomonadales bacterium]|nr:hypothetical protein [Sphingomonadales bacterium]